MLLLLESYVQVHLRVHTRFGLPYPRHPCRPVCECERERVGGLTCLSVLSLAFLPNRYCLFFFFSFSFSFSFILFMHLFCRVLALFHFVTFCPLIFCAVWDPFN